MKKIKTIVALLLVAAMALCLGGCGKFETKMAKAARQMAKLESFRMDMDMDMGLSLSMMGESEDLDMLMDFQGDVLVDPMKMGGNMNVSVLDEDLELPFYMEMSERGWTLYMSLDEGESWQKTEWKPEDFASLEAQETKMNLAYYAKLAETFEETGKETVRGSEATVFSGYIPGEELSQGFSEGLEAGMNTVSEDLDMDLSALDFSDMDDIPVTIAIDDKSGMVTRVTMDMTEVMQKVLDEVMKLVLRQMAGEYGMEDMDPSALADMLSIEVSRVELAMEFYDFDAVKDIEIPQEALDAELLEAA